MYVKNDAGDIITLELLTKMGHLAMQLKQYTFSYRRYYV